MTVFSYCRVFYSSINGKGQFYIGLLDRILLSRVLLLKEFMSPPFS